MSKLFYRLVICLAAVSLAGNVSAQTIFSDDFSAGAINTAIWTTDLPFQSSNVAITDGGLITSGRGLLATTNDMPTAFVLTGTFRMLNEQEHFGIILRSDLATYGSLFERTGILVSFSNDSNEISIQQLSNNNHSILALGNYNLITNRDYVFRVENTGSQVSLAIDGIAQISAETYFQTGNRAGFYSREFPSTSTRLDSVALIAVPEAPITGVIGILTLALAAFVRSKRSSKSNFGTS